MVTEDQVKAFIDDNIDLFMKNHMGLEGPFKLVSEYTITNGQQVDKVVIGTNDKIITLIECKGEVALNEFVRGTGQAIQGAFQMKKNINGNFSENAQSFLLVPIEMAQDLPLDLFDYHNFSLIFVNIKNKTTLKYDDKDYKSTKTNEWITINPYYFRDCSLEGIYFYLKMILKNSGQTKRNNLMEMEKMVKKIRDQSGVDFFGDIRNNHIIPSVLGFYNQFDKSLTLRGYEFAKKQFPEFCKEIVLRELGEYSRAVFLAILSFNQNISRVSNEYIKISTKELSDFIKEIYEGKKVTYLFDPDGGNRNLLTMIRMLETIGAIKRSKDGIKINYFPMEGMPFLMEKFNTGYIKKLNFWFKKFNLPL